MTMTRTVINRGLRTVASLAVSAVVLVSSAEAAGSRASEHVDEPMVIVHVSHSVPAQTTTTTSDECDEDERQGEERRESPFVPGQGGRVRVGAPNGEYFDRGIDQTSRPVPFVPTEPPAAGGDSRTVGRQAFAEISAAPPKTMMGIRLEPVGGALASQLRLEAGNSILVTAVLPGLPAQRAGVQLWDIVLECNNIRPLTDEAFRAVLAKGNPGDRLNLVILRGGREVETTVTLEAYNQARVDTADRAAFPEVATGARSEMPQIPEMLPEGWSMDPEERAVAMRLLKDTLFAPSADGTELISLVMPDVRADTMALQSKTVEVEQKLSQIDDRLRNLELMLDVLVKRLEKETGK